MFRRQTGMRDDSREQVWRRCAALVDELEFSHAFDIKALCTRVADRRGRAIRLLAKKFPPGGPSGLCISTDHADYVIYQESTSPLHQEHIILHEIGHLLCEHEAEPVFGSELARTLLPSLDPQLVQRVLGRSHYSSRQEQEAEIVASLILQRAKRMAGRPTEATSPVAQRLQQSLVNPDGDLE
jgi:hypothetical protein